MNCIVPFTKNIKFDTKLGDIISMSLEHEYNINEGVILGNFMISGTFKSHELSVNPLDFSHTIPFDLNLTEDIEEASLVFKIDNFTYEVIEDDYLKVDIDFMVSANTKEVVREEIFESVPKELENIVFDNLDLLDDVSSDEVFEEVINNKVDVKEEVIVEEEEIVLEDPTCDRVEVEESTILDFANKNEETFISYKVHCIKDGESIESICKLYSKQENELTSYNANIKFLTGDKIIIPEDEE